MSRTDRVSRTIDASPDRVYQALVDRQALETWLPPTGMTGEFEHFDPRPGGSYRLVLTYLDPRGAFGKAGADTDVIEVRYLELVPGARVVQAVDFVSDDPAFHGTMTMMWEVTEFGAGARVDLRADDVPTGISEQEHLRGMNSSLTNLAAYLENH